MKIEDVYSICIGMENPKETGVVNGDTFKDRIAGLKKEKFSGVVCLTFNYGGVLSSQWIILERGAVRSIFLEEDIRKESKKRNCDMMTVTGYLEIFEFTDAQLDEISQLFETRFSKEKHIPGEEEMRRCRRTFSTMKKDLKGMFGEKIAGGVIRKHLTMDDGLQSIYSGKMAVDALKTQISRLHIDMAHPTTGDLERLIDAIKENVLVKFLGPQLAEKSANRYRTILFLDEEPVLTKEDILSKPDLEKLNVELEKVINDRSIDIIKAHVLDLNIDMDNITKEDVDRLIEGIHTNVLKKILGTKKAEILAKRYKRLLIKGNEEEMNDESHAQG